MSGANDIERASGGRFGPLPGFLLVAAVCFAAYFPGLDGEVGERAERDLLLRDRVVDSTAPWTDAFGKPAGPLADRPVSRLLLRLEATFWLDNPLGFRLGGVFLLILLGLATANVLRRLLGEGPIPWLVGLLLAISPLTAEPTLWIAARGDLFAAAVGVTALLGLLAVWQRRRQAEVGRGSPAAAVLGGAALAAAGLVFFRGGELEHGLWSDTDLLSVGVVVALALGIVCARAQNRLVVGLLGAAILLAGWRTVLTVREMRSPLEFFEQAATRDPGQLAAQFHMARERSAAGQLKAGVRDLRTALVGEHQGSELLGLELARQLVDLAANESVLGTADAGASTAGEAIGLLDGLLAKRAARERIDPLLVRARANLILQPAGLRNALADLKDVETLLQTGDPRHYELYLLLGNVLTHLAYDEEARAAYENCVRQDPLSFEANYHSGNFLVSQADTLERNGELAEAAKVRQRAIDRLRAAYASRALDREGLYGRALVMQLGGNLGRIGHTDEARALLEQGLEIWPDDPRMLFNHALTLLGSPSTILRGETEMAAALEGAEKQGLPEAEYYRNILVEHLVQRGNTLLKGGDKKEAERLAAEAVRVAPRFFAARMLRGDVYFAGSLFTEAIAEYDEAATLEPAPAGQRADPSQRARGVFAVRLKRGHAVLKRGYANALVMSELRVRATKQPTVAEDARRQFYVARAAAIADIEEFLAVLEGDEDEEAARKRLEAIQKWEFDEAKEEPVAPAPSDPHVEELMREMLAKARKSWEEGVGAFEKEDYKTAAQLFRKARSYNSREIAYHYWLGRALGLVEGEEAAAVTEFQWVLREAEFAKFPDLTRTFLYLAEVQKRVGDRAAAIENTENYLRLAPPDDPLAERARALLLDLRE